jgi:Kef-type K+ transport system membrane component KefB
MDVIVVAYVGAILFGLVIGWFTSRMLARRAGGAHVSHIAAVVAVVAVVGGGYVTVISGDRGLFGMYAIGLFVGFIAYAAVFHRLHNDRNKIAFLLGLDSFD